jgi:hypothetical protein
MANSGAGGPSHPGPQTRPAPPSPEDTPGLPALRRQYPDWDIQPIELGGLTGWIAVTRPHPRFTAAVDLDELRVQMRVLAT